MYSQIKPAWHRERIAAIGRGDIVAPVHVQMILSDLCNQDCHFCAYRMSSGLSNELFPMGGIKNPNRKIPTERALELVNECADLGVKAIQFTGGGEPTVHPHHLRIFRRAQDLGMKTGLVTNGVKLFASDAIMDMTWIRVSIDAGNMDDYCAVRRVSPVHWTKVWNNIKSLKGYQGKLGVGFVVTPQNYMGIADCAKIAQDAGAHYMRVGAVFSDEGIKFYGDLIPEIIEQIEKAKEIGFPIADLFGRRLDDLEARSPTHPRCGYQRMTAYIGGDLNLYRCCNTAYTVHGKVADLSSMSLEEALTQYEPFDARTCRFCQFLGQNQVINGLIDEPEHVDFV